jgi:hypothetical protein
MPHSEMSTGSSARPDRRRPGWLFGERHGPTWMDADHRRLVVHRRRHNADDRVDKARGGKR